MIEASESFWIVFDTSTKPDYYADVHNLLALPAGWIIRYNYRRALLSLTAEDAVFGSAPQPTPALLVYAQAPSYTRGGQLPEEDIPSGMLFVATRLADIALIPEPEGEYANFDLVVRGYPPPGHAAFEGLMRSLVALKETPYLKWVTISAEINAFREIEAAASDKNWEGTVDVLATPPMQFIDDVFWRLGTPTSPRESLTALGDELRTADGSRVYQVQSRLELHDGREAVFPVISHTPAGGATGVEDRRYVEVNVPPDQRISFVGSGPIELRRTSQAAIRLRAKDTDEASTTTDTVRLSTLPTRAGWPRGPEFELLFVVSKGSSRLILGILLLLLVPAFGVLATAIENIPFRVVFAVLAAAAAILGWAVLTGKIAKP